MYVKEEIKVKKLISSLLVITLLTCSFPIVASAKDNLEMGPFSDNILPISVLDKNILLSETYTSNDLGFTLERIVKENQTIVFAKSLDGQIIHTAISKGGNIYLDDKLVEFTNFEYKINEPSYSLDSLKWGGWQYNFLGTFKTGGLGVAAIAALIALYAGFTPVGVAAALAAVIAGKYDEISIYSKHRTGADDKFQYIDRITTYYGDGKFIQCFGFNPYEEHIKRPLNY